MSTFNVSDAEKMMNPLVTVVPSKYLDALLILNNELKDKRIEWALSGDIGEILRTVHVEPSCIEIVTNREGAEKIHQAVQTHQPTEIEQRTEELPRPALLDGKEYPVKIRSYYFEFKMESIPVKVYGDLQYQIADWEWGDKIEFKPDYVNVVGKNIAVTPLVVRYEIYTGLGWRDRSEKVMFVLARGHRTLTFRKK